jgi:hypothetical protein
MMSKILFIASLAIFLVACDQSKVKVEFTEIEGICETSSNSLIAHYKIFQSRAGSSKQDSTQSLSLHRYGGEVMHSYPELHITERWNKTSHGGLQKFRYFDEDNRAIEYDSTAPLEDIDQRWQEKHQLVSQSALENMSVKQEISTECGVVTVYEQKSDNSLRHIYWSADLELLIKLFHRKGLDEETWELQSLNGNPEIVLESFADRERYLSTDFADIGDQETDPFFRKMINLGFIEHGASGFYDADGNDIGDHHHH